MILAYQSADSFWTVCHSEQIFCHRVTRPQAVAAVVAAFPELPLAEIEGAFDSPADASTFQAATQSTLASVESTCDQLSESAELARIKALVTLTHAAVSDMAVAIDRENQSREAETKVKAEALAAFKTEQAKQAAAAEQKRQAVIEAQKRKAIEEDRVRDRRTVKTADGGYEFSEADQVNLGGPTLTKIRRIIQRFAPGEPLTAEAERWLR